LLQPRTLNLWGHRKPLNFDINIADAYWLKLDEQQFCRWVWAADSHSEHGGIWEILEQLFHADQLGDSQLSVNATSWMTVGVGIYTFCWMVWNDQYIQQYVSSSFLLSFLLIVVIFSATRYMLSSEIWKGSCFIIVPLELAIVNR
jgi:hypothetical protein